MKWIASLVLFTLCINGHAKRIAASDVLTTIRPLQMIAQEIAGEHYTVRPLLPASVSHHYSLKASDHYHIKASQLVIWIGPELERFLEKAIDERALPTLQIGELALNWPDDHHEAHDDHDHDAKDPHVWLDPQNVKLIGDAIAEKLSEMNPSAAEDFQKNAQSLAIKMDRLEAALQSQLTPIKNKAFIVLHPAYGHFVERFGLNQIDFIVKTPEQAAGAKHLLALRQKKVECVMGEVGHAKSSAAQLSQALGARLGELDPLGSKLDGASIDRLIQTIADEFVQCFDPA